MSTIRGRRRSAVVGEVQGRKVSVREVGAGLQWARDDVKNVPSLVRVCPVRGTDTSYGKRQCDLYPVCVCLTNALFPACCAPAAEGFSLRTGQPRRPSVHYDAMFRSRPCSVAVL